MENKENKLMEITPGFTSLQSFELAQRAANLLASSTLVPKEYQKNLSNCVIALNMATRMNADPLMVMQNLYIVNGKPGWSSQFLISTFNTSGRYSALRYEWSGTPNTDDWGCKAWAIEKATSTKLEGAVVTIKTAKDEGWYGKSGSKWRTMPQQMLMYRAASWFIRAYAPELAMGMQTAEELVDTIELDRSNYTVSVEQEVQQEVKERANKEVIDFPPKHSEPQTTVPSTEPVIVVPPTEEQAPTHENNESIETPEPESQQSFFSGDEGPGF